MEKENNNPLISIIVPVYKVEQYLHECVDSILSQTFTDFKCILVDDGSPDNCPKICDEYAKKDSRVKVIHKENGGLSDARNAGINVAIGEYLIFVDSDDKLVNDTCLSNLNVKRKEPVIPLEERCRIIEALECVDEVVVVNPAEVEDKMAVLKNYKFDVLFSGDDWKDTERYNKTEKQFEEYGASIEYLPYTKGISTSDLKERILDKTKITST